MIGRIAQSAVLSLLLLFAGSSFAAESKVETSAKPAARKVKLVDINAAGKAQLKTLPGIGDAEADRIIAGRPYLSKADLVSANVISRKTYEGLKSRVIAKQNSATEAKLRQLQEKQKGR
jgi:competence protein ComEA